MQVYEYFQVGVAVNEENAAEMGQNSQSNALA